MRYPKLNTKLLNCVLKFLKKHPRNYSQNTWLAPKQMQSDNICGTTGCVAGWTCMLTLPKEVKWKDWALTGNNGFRPDFEGIARTKLGLTTYEAKYLFGGTDRPRAQQLDLIKRRVARIKQARKIGANIYDISDPE